jgi:hypothetical protein
VQSSIMGLKLCKFIQAVGVSVERSERENNNI